MTRPNFEIPDDNMSQSKRVFLSAEWRDLVMLNYAVDPHLLTGHAPRGTVVDSFEGKTYVSLVGFRFCHTKLFGRLPVPFHTDFDEVNLRFYVRRKADHEDRRGVVFIAEVVPRRAIAKIARILYGENYVCLPMRHNLVTAELRNTVEYRWRLDGRWCSISAQTAELPKQPSEGSLEQFISEHYWGYAARRAGETVEYQVSHVPWKVWATPSATFEGEASTLYGKDLGAILRQRPDSAFVATGSPVIVFRGNKIQ